MAVDTVTNKIYVANQLDNTGSVVDEATNSVIATVAVGANPGYSDVDSTLDQIYVSYTVDQTVTMLDGTTGVTLPLNGRVRWAINLFGNSTSSQRLANERCPGHEG
jgi:YVTN family beta-propeller protein